MCGIVGIYLKSKKFEKSLGGMLSKMFLCVSVLSNVDQHLEVQILYKSQFRRAVAAGSPG